MPSRVTTVMDALLGVLTGLATTGSRVKKTRAYSVPESQVNALTLRLGGEVTAEELPTTYIKARDIEVVIHVQGKETEIDGTVAQIEAEIWAAIQADVTLGLTFVQNTEFIGTEPVDHEAGQLATAILEQTWRVYYSHAVTSMES